MNIYVGNLSYSTRDEDLRQLYEQFGEVSAARVVMDRETGRSRGFGFVEMPDNAAGAKAIEQTNGTDFMGRNLKVNESQPRSNDGPRGGGYRGGGGGGDRQRW
ncbi:MAG: RNA recognition motif domain-containing protein [Thermodesulfobacteriota bacterium]